MPPSQVIDQTVQAEFPKELLDQIRASSVARHIAPHASRAAALWGVLTRMRKPQVERYEKPLQELVGKLGPLDKAYLYAHRRPPAGLSAEQTKEVLACQPCQRTVCTMNDHRCMRDIPAADVVDTVQQVLAQVSRR